MNEILINRELLINSDNEGILKELLSHTAHYNTLWGSEYMVMNDKGFIESNVDAIIDIMTKSKILCRH